MARLRPYIAILLCGILVSPLSAQNPKPSSQAPADTHDLVKPDPKQASKLVEMGEQFEEAGKFDRALASYELAARYAPFDVTIVSKANVLRNKLLRQYTDAAEKYAAAGDFQDATVQLASALQIDPNNTVVLERMHQLAAMSEGKNAAVQEEPPVGLAVADPAKVSRDFKLRTDLRGAFEQVAAAYGLKAIFDPDLPTRNVRLNVQDVDFATAMKILTAQTGTFWRAINSKLIFVAADTADKRRTYDQQIEQTFILPSSVDSTEMSEIVRTVRELTGVVHIQQSAPNHSLTIRDSVQRVHLAAAIIHDIEQARGEVLLEIDLLEVDRNKARQLGITPPASLRLYSIPPNLIGELRSATDYASLLTLLTQIFGTVASGGITSLASAIPPIAAIGGGKTTFLLGLPSVTANFSDMLTLVHSGRQVLLRAQDGKPATFFVGDRYPITLSLLSGSLGSAPTFTGNPGGTPVTIPVQEFTVGAGPIGLATADFRAIGSQDVAVLNELDNTITILLNQGDGATAQFAQAPNSPISLGAARTAAPAIPASITTGNINPIADGINPITGGDNLPDLLVTDPVANTVTIFLNAPAANGTFLPPLAAIPVGKQPSAIVTGTFNTNLNANVGFIVTNFTDNTYSVFNGNGDGTFVQAPGSPFALPVTERGPYAITVADFNADGKSDIAIVNQTTNNVSVLEGNGNGTFTEFPGSPLTVGKFPVAIASGSFSASTGPGLAVVNQNDNTVSVFFGNGDGTFVVAPQSPFPTNTKPTGIAISDFAGQANGGFAVTNTDTGTVTIYADLGSGVLTNVLEPAVNANPGAILVGDFANSSFPDIIVANNNNQVGVAGEITLLVSPASVVSNPSIAQQPYPGSEYEDIGLKVKATPQLHMNDDVTVQFEFEIKALAGTNLNGIPVITNRTLSQTVRLKENETSLIGGLLDRQQTKTVTGIPGLAEIPGLDYAFASHNDTSTDTDFLILVTPRKVRLPVHDTRTIYAGRGDGAGRALLGTVAPPPQAAPEQQVPLPENQPPAGQSQPRGEPPPPAQEPPEQQNPPLPEQNNPQNPPPEQTHPQP